MNINKLYLSIGISLLALNVFADEAISIDSILNHIEQSASQVPNIDLTQASCYINQQCTNKFTKQFYTQNPSQRLWLNDSQANADSIKLINILQNSYYEGLDPSRYQVTKLIYLYNQIKSAHENNTTLSDKVLFDYELSLTDAYLNYANDIQNGVINPNKTYQYWHVDKDSGVNIYGQFIGAVNSHQLIDNLNNAANNHPEPYLALRKQLDNLIHVYQNGKNTTPIVFHSTLKYGMSNNTIAQIKQLLSQSHQYDLASDTNLNKFNDQLLSTIKQIQSANGLKPTGWIDKKTMNIISPTSPSLANVKKIAINMDRMRWLPDKLASRRVWVNIPSYQLQIFENNSLVKTMPVIVGGGKENKTCSTISKIKTIELNPFWGVPNRIATKEYLRKIQESSGYLANHDMKIYKSGSNAEIDPTTVDWSKVTQKNFNYYIKQQPGNKNALGQYKFMFNNDCGIYLHDTANRGLFGRSDRSLSHGCVRVGNPKFLAQYLTDSNTNGLNFTKVQKIVSDKQHKFVSLSSPIDVYIVYYTAFVDSVTGRMTYLNDIYGLDNIPFNINIPAHTESELISNE